MSSINRLGPREAWQALQSNPKALLLDVRDPLEFDFVGHPVGAVNIPWKLAPHWEANPHFVDEVRQRAPDLDLPIFVLCRSGQRSLDAAQALARAGYRELTNVEEGFEGPLDGSKHRGSLGGWRCRGLPWEQG